jgi:hypothetical protein
MDYVKNVCFWVIIPLVNFLIWRDIGLRNAPAQTGPMCPTPILSRPEAALNYSMCSQYAHLEQAIKSKSSPNQQIMLDENLFPNFESIGTLEFDKFKANQLAHIKPSSRLSIVVNSYQGGKCSTYATVTSSDKPQECVAIAHSSSIDNSALLQRFTADEKKTGRKLDKDHPKSSGYFRNVAKKKGRESQIAKTKPLFQHLTDIQEQFDALLTARGLKKGDDIVMMVANDGEIDLFLNFACSCRKHGISLHNVMLIAGSR